MTELEKGTMLTRALEIVIREHANQVDRGGNPYILHPITVMTMLDTSDEELQAIALLHDVVEDTELTCSDLYCKGFSDRVVEAVRCLTKIDGQSYEQYKDAVKSNRDSVIVKLADLKHNMDLKRLKKITQKDVERRIKYDGFYTELQIALQNFSN